MSVLFVVPTLGRRPDLLRSCLESIRAQDLPTLDIVTPSVITVYDKRVKNLKIGVEDLWSNGADIYLEG